MFNKAAFSGVLALGALLSVGTVVAMDPDDSSANTTDRTVLGTPKKEDSKPGLLKRMQNSPLINSTCIIALAAATAGLVTLSLNKAPLNLSATQEKCVGPISAILAAPLISYLWKSNISRHTSFRFLEAKYEYPINCVLAGGLYCTLRGLLQYYTGK